MSGAPRPGAGRASVDAMLRVGLTGGIGSGKTTVARELARLGAVVVDADEVARAVVEPGTRGLAEVVEEFGPEILRPDGTLDRAALASIVFADPDALRRLGEITHPLVAAESVRLTLDAPREAIVVHDVPLIVENGLAGDYDLVVVVGAGEDVRLERVVRSRSLSREDALARIRAQADDGARRAVADVWLENEGSEEELLAAVRRLWTAKLAPMNEAMLARG